MELIPCKLKKHLTQSTLFHPLHLVADKVKWNTRFGKGFNSPLVISIFEKQNKLHKPGLFVLVHLDNCPSNQTINENNYVVDLENGIKFNYDVELFCSEEFLVHYNMHLSSNNLAFVSVTAFPLNEVILSADTDEVFQWAQEPSFEAGLLVASSCCCNSFLLRDKDIFLSPPVSAYGGNPADIIERFKQLHVVRCSPVQQGLVTINTSLIVVKSKQSVDQIKNQTRMTTKNYKNYVVKFIDYQLFCFHEGADYFSSFSKIYACKTLAEFLNLENNSFVNLFMIINEKNIATLENENKKSFSKPFLFQVLTDHIWQYTSSNAQSTGSENVLYMSNVDWLNFIGEEFSHHIYPNMGEFKLEKIEENSLNYAKEVHLSLVLSPNYLPSGCFDKSLIKFFKNVKILRVGDVLSINVRDDYDFYNAADLTSIRCRILYYKIIKIDNRADDNQFYLVDSSHTLLYQNGTINSFIPVQQELSNSVGSERARTQCGVLGLSGYVAAVKDIVLPYLDENNQFDHVCSILLYGQAGCGKRSIVNELCLSCYMHLVEVDCLTFSSDTSGAGEAKINEAFRRASLYTPCIVLLTNIDNVGVNKETNRADNRVCGALFRAIDSLPRRCKKTYPAVVIAVTSDKDKMLADIRMQFLHQVAVNSPDESERQLMLRSISNFHQIAPDINYQWLAKHTAGFVFGDFWELMKKATCATYDRIIEQCAIGNKLSWIEEESLAMAGITLTHDDVAKALQQMQSDRADIIGVPKIPDVDWKDIGGLEEVKSHILDTVQLPLDHPELVSTGLRRSGVLLYGPPGTGKTLLAKAVASQCSLNFLSVKGPELINMYVGQSEANVRRVFQRARDAAPCVVFFDELDALAPSRGRSGDSGGVMDRVVSQLLSELDGMNSGGGVDKQVFIIAASNRPDLIDQAILRPGRLDNLLYVGVSESTTDRIKVLQAQTRKLNLSPRVNLEEVVSACPPNMTGADFYGLTSEAAMNAIRRNIRQIEAGEDISSRCVIEQDDFMGAAQYILPSLSNDQLNNYKRVKVAMVR